MEEEGITDRMRGVKVEPLQEYVLLRAVRPTREWLRIPWTMKKRTVLARLQE
jgi:hypothetical protein